MNKPLRLGLAGADASLILQLTRCAPDLNPVALAEPQLDAAIRALAQAGIRAPQLVTSAAELDTACARGQFALLEDLALLGQATSIDIVVDATASVPLGAELALAAFAHAKPLVVLHPVLLATLGPILQQRAQQTQTPLALAHGSPAMALIEVYRFVSAMGLRPCLAGIAGAAGLPYFDLALAANWLNLALLTTPLDLALGHALNDLALPETLNDQPQLASVRAAAPAVFVLAETAFPQQAAQLEHAGFGQGPLFCFTQAAGFGFLEIVRTIQYVNRYSLPQLTPRYMVAGRLEKALKQGERISTRDYEPYVLAFAESPLTPLPYPLAEGCRLTRDYGPGEIVSWFDITPPAHAAARLYAEQLALLKLNERV
jgi:predicted homoserine dehydrogenase-like protein